MFREWSARRVVRQHLFLRAAWRIPCDRQSDTALTSSLMMIDNLTAVFDRQNNDSGKV